MSEQHHSIFREQAARRYFESRERSVLPRYISPPVRACLWLLLVMLVASGAVSWFASIPVHGSGQAVVINASDIAQRDILLAVFLPSRYLPHLRAGQCLSLSLDNKNKRLIGVVTWVAPGISSPEAAQRQFSLVGGAAEAITHPSAVAIARLRLPPEIPASAYAGSVYPVSVELGSRRVISLLPMTGSRTYGE